MQESTIKTPGVYINEINTSTGNAIRVATAIPAFIGYTPKAEYSGKSYHNIPLKINSLQEFENVYGFSQEKNNQHFPQYYIKEQPNGDIAESIILNEKYYTLEVDPATVYYLYNSIKLFFINGGEVAYIISVGNYGASSGKSTICDREIINPNVKLDDLLKGIDAVKNTIDVTLYICPEATLLTLNDNSYLMQKMLRQCSELNTAIAIFDIKGTNSSNISSYKNSIADFRSHVGNTSLSYGAAYCPFVRASFADSINYTNFFGGDIMQLKSILDTPYNAYSAVVNILKEIHDNKSASDVSHYHKLLLEMSTTYKWLINAIQENYNLIPPSGAMAGIITRVDNNSGVWQAPANVAAEGVTSLAVNLSDEQQGDMNVHVSGKSVNAIRSFLQRGVLVWGARTLDSNSLEWRYIAAKRTAIFIEQSCRETLKGYQFQSNNSNTWAAIKSVMSSFLTELWREGALMGSKPSDAFAVDCGLGTTMTATDILNGYIILNIKIAIIRPAEFIEITIAEKMATDI